MAVKLDSFLQDLSQYLGIEEQAMGSDDQAAAQDLIMRALTGDAPTSVRPEFKEELISLKEQEKGYTAGQKEAMTAGKRQELAAAARQSGMQGGQMLAGKSRLAAAGKAQMEAAMQQSKVQQEMEEANRKRMEAAKEASGQLEQKIASIDATRQDEYSKLKGKVGLNIANLMALREQNK